jgi:hypothetical protein
LAVNLLTIADAHNKDAQSTVLDAGDDSPIPNAVFPESSKFGAFEGFANAARVVELSDTAMQKSEDAAGGLLVDLA